MRPRGSAPERGESLIELLVALLIMGTAVVAVVGGLGTAIIMSDVHRKQAGVAGHLKIFAANLESAIAASPTQYVDCATLGSYPDYTPGAPYDADVTRVLYWNGHHSAHRAPATRACSWSGYGCGAPMAARTRRWTSLSESPADRRTRQYAAETR
jgi:Tfp pilus assembly protein PilV